ncbi:hypothetical protein ACHAXT_000642 [Thalassiosira profunda]
MTSSFGDGADGSPGATVDGGKNGRIWIHRPFQLTPDPSSATAAVPITSSCPLPKSTPRPALQDRLHHIHLSSPTPERALEEMHRSKSEFYQSQFASRVANEDRKRIERRTLRSPSGLGDVDATIYLPRRDSKGSAPTKLQGICLHVHGGGWLWGDSSHQVAHRCLEMADALNAAVVSVEYSLFCHNNVHSNAFNPVNDVAIAIDWIEAKGAAKLNTLPSFVASGESSGAHLLMLAMLKRRDNAGASPSQWKCWDAINLVYGVFDLSGTPSIRADQDSSPLCGNDLLWMYDLYASKVETSKKATDHKHPSLSPLYANLSHMPPALISVGTSDPLIDDSLFMAQKLSGFGNDVELAIYENGEHGIGHFGLQEDEEMGVRARKNTLEFLKRHLQGS